MTGNVLRVAIQIKLLGTKRITPANDIHLVSRLLADCGTYTLSDDSF